MLIKNWIEPFLIVKINHKKIDDNSDKSDPCDKKMLEYIDMKKKINRKSIATVAETYNRRKNSSLDKAPYEN